MTLQAIKWNRMDGKLEILDQTLLPGVTHYVQVEGVKDGWEVINKMQVNSSFNYECLPRLLTLNCFMTKFYIL